MARIEDYRSLFMTGSLILILIAVTPTISFFIRIPDGSEKFSELWLLGPTRKAEGYPFNITRNHNYTVFLGIGNHLGYSAYYLVKMKFRNQTQSAPDSYTHTPSNTPALFNITAFVTDEGIWELPLTFSFDYESTETFSHVEFYNMTLNDFEIDMKNYRVMWDPENNGLLGYLFFELWLYNMTSRSFQFHNRWVGIWLNATSYNLS